MQYIIILPCSNCHIFEWKCNLDYSTVWNTGETGDINLQLLACLWDLYSWNACVLEPLVKIIKIIHFEKTSYNLDSKCSIMQNFCHILLIKINQCQNGTYWLHEFCMEIGMHLWLVDQIITAVLKFSLKKGIEYTMGISTRD